MDACGRQQVGGKVCVRPAVSPPFLAGPCVLVPQACWWSKPCDHVVLAVSGADSTETGPVQPIVFEVSVKERRNGGHTWREHARSEGGRWSVIDDSTPVQRACGRSRSQTSFKFLTRSRVPPLPVGVGLDLVHPPRQLILDERKYLLHDLHDS